MKLGLASGRAQPIPTLPSARDMPSAPRAARVADDDRIRWLLLGCAAFLYLPFVFAGPGSDPDSLRELHSGATLLSQHRYVLSRPPGYFPYEALCGVVYALGGAVATNLATIAMSLAALDSFLRICERFAVPHRYLLAATMAIHPIYWASSTSTIDFIWALGCFLVGFRLLLIDRYFGAAAMLGLAVGIRLSSILLAAPLLIWELIERPRDARLWVTAALAAAIGASLYIPEFVASGNSLSFLTYYLGEWSLTDHFGRFIYKNVYFWGLPTTICLVAIAPMLVRRLLGCDRKFSRIIMLSASIVIGFEALFLKIPVQRAYLLPMLPFVLIVLGIALRDRMRMLLAITILILSFNFVNLNLARPDIPDRATRAILGVVIEPGYLLTDVAARLALARRPIPRRLPYTPMPESEVLENAGVTPRRGRLAANLAWNLAGESMPVLAAAAAIPILLHKLGPDRFGVLTLSWMIAGYFGLFDFGLGRALTKAMAQELSIGRGAKAATLFWTSLAMMLVLGAAAGLTLASMAPWLTRSALKIPLALRAETLAGFYVIAIGLPMLISSSALRAALIAADRFDLLNFIRTPSGILSFVAPVLMLPFTRSLAWLIGALIVNRALSWAIYFGVIVRALPELRFHPRIDLACVPPLLGFGAWITVSNVITPMMVYLDRFLIGALLSMAALTAYSVPMEIVSKSFILPAAVSGVMFPAFARSFPSAPAVITALFGRALKLVALVLCPLCAAVAAFSPQIMSLWIGQQFAAQSAAVLQILAVGAFVTGLSWIPLALLHGAHRPDLPAKIHLIDFPIYALVLWICVRRFGLTGAALTWSGRLLAENLVMFTMASRFIAASRREIAGAFASLILAIALIAAGTLIAELWSKAIFLCGVIAASGVVAWRFLLDGRARSQIFGFIPSMLRPAFGKVAD